MEPQTLIQRGQMGFSKQQKQLREASTAPVAPVASAVAPVKQYNAGGGVVNPYNRPVTSASMAPAAPLNLPPVAVPTAPTNTQAAIAGSTANAVRTSEMQAQQAAQQAQPTQSDNLARTMQDVFGIQNEMAEATSSVDRAAQDQARMDADRYTSEIEAKALATRRQVEELRKNNPLGAFGGALEDNIRDIERASLSEQADLAILQNSALRNFDTAKSIADRQLELKLEPLKTKLENLKFFYQENKEIFNIADNRAYQEKIKSEEREYKKTEAIETQLNELKKNVAQYAGNNAQSILTQLSRIDTKNPKAIEQALSIAKDYISTPAEKLDLQIKQQQLNKIRQDISQSSISFSERANEAKAATVTVDAKAMDSDPDFKKLKGNAALQEKLVAYQKAIEDFGGGREGGRTAKKLEPYYQDALQAYRAAVDLGALQGGDIALVEGFIAKPTYEQGLVTGGLNVASLGLLGAARKAVNVRNTNEALDEALAITARNMEGQKKLVKSKKPEWAETPYYQAVAGIDTELQVDENGNIVIETGESTTSNSDFFSK